MIVYYVSGALAILFARLSEWSKARAASEVSRRKSVSRSEGFGWAVLCGLVLITVGAFRWRVGTDYPNYAAAYPRWSGTPLSDYGFLDEPGLAVIAKVGAVFFDDYAMMLGLASVVTTWLFVRMIYRTSDMFAFSIALFMLSGPWLGSFNGVRQYLACAVIFAGHRFILDRKFLKYLGVVVLATLFHVSALVTILFYFVPRRRLTVLSGAFIVIGALVVAESYGRLLEVVSTFRPESDLTTSYVTSSIHPLRVAVALAPLVLFILIRDKSRLKPEDHFYTQLLFINAASFFAAFGSAYIARFTAYSLIFVCVGIPRLLPRETSRQFRAMIILLVLALFFAFWHYETSHIIPLSRFLWIFERDPDWVP